MATSTATITRTEMKVIQEELDMMEIKVMRLKARLIPTEKISDKERREIRAAEKRIAEGKWISLDELTKEFS